ncbi:MAG: hypothetical protein GW859_05655 [Sphingomonadales bacterium]|nr:hypothetical protein [Sphingomonadales bacterium]
MRASLAWALTLPALAALPGCVAAIPAGAAALMAGKEMVDKPAAPDLSVAPRERRIAAIPAIRVVEKAPAIARAPTLAAPVAAVPPAPRADRDRYDTITRYLFTKADERERGALTTSVVLMPGSDLADPRYTVCGDLPLAMLVDLGDADAARIAARDPALVETVTVARLSGIAVHYLSALPPAQAGALVAALETAGLGPAAHRDNLWMSGDYGSTSKDSLRWKVASRSCIVAQLGDEASDFSETFTAQGATDPQGWFVVDAFAHHGRTGDTQ